MEESPKKQIERLANFIMEEVPGEPSQSEGAVDTAIRWMREKLKAVPEKRPNSTGFVLCPTCKEFIAWDDQLGAWCDRCNHRIRVRTS